MTSKNAASDTPSEILFGTDEIKISSVAGIDKVVSKDGGVEAVIYDSGVEQGSRPLSELMMYETELFTQMFITHDKGNMTEQEKTIYQASVDLSRTVNKITTKARQTAGIFFAGEEQA